MRERRGQNVARKRRSTIVRVGQVVALLFERQKHVVELLKSLSGAWVRQHVVQGFFDYGAQLLTFLFDPGQKFGLRMRELLSNANGGFVRQMGLQVG